MQNLQLFLFCLLISSSFFSQTSWEASLGYNRSFDKLEAPKGQELISYQIDENKRYGYTVNTTLNFFEHKLISPSVGLMYNYDYLLTAYKTSFINGIGNYTEQKKQSKRMSHFIKVNGMLKFNSIELASWKFIPFVGLNVNILQASQAYSYGSSYYGTSYYPNSYNSHSRLFFNFEAISGMQIERKITKNLSLLGEFSYIRKLNTDNVYFSTKNEFRITAGIKKNFNRNSIEKDSVKQWSNYFSVGFLKSHYYLKPGEKSSSYYNQVYRLNPKSKISQNGLNFAFYSKKKRILLTNEFNISIIDIDIIASSSQDFLHKAGPGSSSKKIYKEYNYANYLYQAKKVEFEYIFNFGINLLKNKRIEIFPALGFSFSKRTNDKVTQDYYERYYYTHYSYISNSGPTPQEVHYIQDKKFYGKATDYLTTNSSYFFTPRVSILINLKIINNFSVFCNINRNLISNYNISLDDIIDKDYYNLSFGLTYKLR